VPTGTWASATALWTFSDAVTPQPRGIRFEIFRAGDGSTRIKAFQPGVSGTNLLLFDFPIVSNDGRNFTGAQIVPGEPFQEFFFGPCMFGFGRRSSLASRAHLL